MLINGGDFCSSSHGQSHNQLLPIHCHESTATHAGNGSPQIRDFVAEIVELMAIPQKAKLFDPNATFKNQKLFSHSVNA
jgi:hypothetical protein